MNNQYVKWNLKASLHERRPKETNFSSQINQAKFDNRKLN